MKELYTSPEMEIVCFAPVERLANGGKVDPVNPIGGSAGSDIDYSLL